ncbi:hypothetical protein LCGC14_0593390 [marine sediment metagenome]|uniref:Uncharacterized protein n=1 Tax=marine sediment metagenome TaxID=412755 RepID=A0A0F9TZ18_9ZZZZ
MKTVIIKFYTFRYERELMVFSSTKMLLKYYQQKYPRAKRLRVKEFSTFIQVLNHNTPLDFASPTTIKRVIIDEQID